jgi:hypothetical protein
MSYENGNKRHAGTTIVTGGPRNLRCLRVFSVRLCLFNNQLTAEVLTPAPKNNNNSLPEPPYII